MHKIKKLLAAAVVFILMVTVAVTGINLYVCNYASSYFLTEEEAAKLADVDCILVLGCSVKEDQTPSLMLRDRLKTAVKLFQNGVSDRLLMSGDHGRADYNEVQVMKDYAMNAGISDEAVFMDHAGFSTYESMYRARDIFEAKRIVIVTQEYHLYRAVYVARELGLDAYGVAAQGERYHGQVFRDVREAAARVKDYFLRKG